jgi:hypothetical protein
MHIPVIPYDSSHLNTLRPGKNVHEVDITESPFTSPLATTLLHRSIFQFHIQKLDNRIRRREFGIICRGIQKIESLEGIP